ncbi:DUF2339 domain-containing protein [Tropicimonas sp.]|uniref:DUF2339 domain-containing protein n=1 Tax=Tropicimonas sp. TaxID=2067044 RepID=UPI003A856D0A
MDLLALAVIAVLALPVLLIVLTIGYFNLRRDVGVLRSRIDLLEARPGHDIAPVPAPGPWIATHRQAPERATQQSAAATPADAAPAARDRRARRAPPAVQAPAPQPVAPKGPSHADRLIRWLRENWFYVLSAISLALAGIFLVDYGIETGFLTPAMRVALAAVLGVGLIAAGERIRRRSGGDDAGATALLPSTFSGAGIVVLYGAVFGARMLYGLLGPGAALAGLVAVSLVALVFGWFYGPFLAAIGLVGGAAAPFLVGGGSDDPGLFYSYFGMLGILGLAIDGVRKWRWVSWLALAAAIAPAWVLFVDGGAGYAGFAAMLTAVGLGTLACSRMERLPAHSGPPAVLGRLMRRKDDAPHQPVAPDVRIVFGAIAVATVLIVAGVGWNEAEALLAALCLTVLLVALAVWCWRAGALVDSALLPGIGLIALAWQGKFLFARLLDLGQQTPLSEIPPEVPTGVSLFLAFAVAGTLAYAWRSGRAPVWKPVWAAAAVILAPAVAVAIHLAWPAYLPQPGMAWALHVIALAALMTLLAERWARADGPDDRRRMAYAALSALSLIALALFVLLSQAALTVALSVLIVAAAALDRRFGLREMGLFLSVGVAVLGWRLAGDPGIGWALHAPLTDVLLSFLSALAALVAAWLLLAPRGRNRARALAESAFWAYGGIFVSVLLHRAITAVAGEAQNDSYWSLSLQGMVWLLLATVQLRRLEQGGRLRQVRLGLLALYGLIGIGGLAASVFEANPLLKEGAPVVGPWPFDTLMVAYLLPGLLLLWLARSGGGQKALRLGAAVAGGALVLLWLALAVRAFWHGGVYIGLGTSAPELYTYTVVMLALGAGLLFRAVTTADTRLRRVAVAVIGLTVLKVFLIDAAGLTGLLRVFSFLGLGLVLAGLAWLNRWAASRAGAPPDR